MTPSLYLQRRDQTKDPSKVISNFLGQTSIHSGHTLQLEINRVMGPVSSSPPPCQEETFLTDYLTGLQFSKYDLAVSFINCFRVSNKLE